MGGWVFGSLGRLGALDDVLVERLRLGGRDERPSYGEAARHGGIERPRSEGPTRRGEKSPRGARAAGRTCGAACTPRRRPWEAKGASAAGRLSGTPQPRSTGPRLFVVGATSRQGGFHTTPARRKRNSRCTFSGRALGACVRSAAFFPLSRTAFVGSCCAQVVDGAGRERAHRAGGIGSNICVDPFLARERARESTVRRSVPCPFGGN